MLAKTEQNPIIVKVADVLTELQETLKKKNKDYSGDKEDVFANFELSAYLADVTVPQSILVRMSDKMARMANLISSQDGPAVEDERLQDTIKDLIGYAVILLAYLEQGEGSNEAR